MSLKPARSKYSILNQVCNLIPPYLVAKLAREHGVSKKARTFSPWSHVVSLLYAQLTHAMSLNDVCDSLKLHGAKLFAIRRATPPNRNTLSHANRVRSASMAEALFWQALDRLIRQNPRFGGRTSPGLPRRFKRLIHIVDATTIGLVANCIDWARHRRKKAAAKLHLRLNLQSFLPRFAIVDTAKENDNKRAREMCAEVGRGEIVIFDKAYVDFAHLNDLTSREVFWVTRAKDNMQYRVKKRLVKKPADNIVRDDVIVLTHPNSRNLYPQTLRRVEAWVEVDGDFTLMVFLTNHLAWAPSSIAELYKCRWSIEVFFKQIKQTLQLCDFLGHNKNAILWQVWTALLLYVLLRFLSFANGWRSSFKRLFCLTRSVLWDALALGPLLRFYGTAGGIPRLIDTHQQAYFPGFAPEEI